jgi:hypothetical protein
MNDLDNDLKSWGASRKAELEDSHGAMADAVMDMLQRAQSTPVPVDRPAPLFPRWALAAAFALVAMIYPFCLDSTRTPETVIVLPPPPPPPPILVSDTFDVSYDVAADPAVVREPLLALNRYSSLLEDQTE